MPKMRDETKLTEGNLPMWKYLGEQKVLGSRILASNDELHSRVAYESFRNTEDNGRNW